jgi:hypothetical protein
MSVPGGCRAFKDQELAGSIGLDVLQETGAPLGFQGKQYPIQKPEQNGLLASGLFRS